MSKIYREEDCKFAQGELVRVKERIMGGYNRKILYAEAGDTGVVIRVPRTTRPMRCIVALDTPRRPDNQLCISEDNLEAV